VVNLKKQTQSPAYGRKSETRMPCRAHLKKQSQFALARIGAKSLLKGDYENKARCGLPEKQSQFCSVQRSAFSGQRQD
jgi:hypothetical protein